MLHRIIFALLLQQLTFFSYSQVSITSIPSLPNKVSNNAVTSALIDGKSFVYSFAGIDSTKNYKGIHQQCFKYDVEHKIWSKLPDLPSGKGRIAASASTVKNKIYIIGGYEVLGNGSEISYDKVHVFDPSTDQFLPDGTNVPIPIDDHVHAVYRDSLIFIVSGWSNSNNIVNVQIYDPQHDVWSVGTSLPNSLSYKVFGGSGQIIGDTIYYIGGAYYSSNFPLTNSLRKGYINPADPTDITWLKVSNPDAKRYRPATLTIDNKLIWFGGSETSYNYNAMAYNGSGIVEPSTKIVQYQNGISSILPDAGPPIMDIRSIAKIDDKKYIIAGGMKEGGLVTDQCFELDFSTLSQAFNLQPTQALYFYPNPARNEIIIPKRQGQLIIYDIKGKILISANINYGDHIDISRIPKGHHILEIIQRNQIYQAKLTKI